MDIGYSSAMDYDSHANENDLSKAWSTGSSLLLKLPSLSQSSQLLSSPLRKLPKNHQSRVDPPVEHTFPVMSNLPVPTKLKKDDYPQSVGVVNTTKKTVPLMKQALKDANQLNEAARRAIPLSSHLASSIVTDREREAVRDEVPVGVVRASATLRSNQEMQAKDKNVLQLTNSMLSVVRQQEPNKRNKWVAVSSDEGKLASGKKGDVW
jgi:hypothetical protein